MGKTLQYLEALLIKRFKPSLNTKEEYMLLPSMAAHNALKRMRPDLPSDPEKVRCRNGNHYTPNEAIARTPAAVSDDAAAATPAATNSDTATSAATTRPSRRVRAQIR